MSEQLVFELPHRPAFGAEDFLVSQCNETAVRLIDAWPNWSNPVNLIVGPAGSGKSHLANAWRLESKAQVVAASQVSEALLESLVAAPALVVEDADNADVDEKAVFHLLNLGKEQGLSLLMTASSLPGDWPVTLPDLVSRLRSIPVVTIGHPDDELLHAVLVKHFADRQLDVEPAVVTYLTARMERSMDMARRLAGALDRASLESRRKITRQFAGEVLETLEQDAGSS
jgi:chromosomal replication initiation ATPase DnaA